MMLQEDLDAIAQDIPRARGELLKCGTQLTGLLLDVIFTLVRGCITARLRGVAAWLHAVPVG